MVVIGLVGRIGAGKSTVARMFADRGATVIDADRLAHEVLDDPAVVREVVDRFGAGVLDADGRLRRGELAGLVFGPGETGENGLRALEGIVHPRVRRRVENWLAEIREREVAGNRGELVVLDVPLLMQAGWDGLCDRLVIVDCEDSVRRQRLASRGWSEAQATARDRAWERGYVRPEAAAKINSVDASGDPAYTRAQVDRICDEWLGD
ncbi:MAG: dephospho-CoA kinase [Planctomycetia bacterium]|nr:dephospho-CoA kinase [Planctomycetia bacterium]